jgi:hypothetical protein
VNAPPPNAATESIVSQLVYLTSEGLDLNEPKAMGLYSILRSGTLPSRDEIIYRYLNEGKTPDEAANKVTLAVNQVRWRLNEVAWDKDLRPPGSAVQIFVDALDKLANGAAAPAPRGGPASVPGCAARDRYACSNRKQKGTCDNRLMITRREIETRVLGA